MCVRVCVHYVNTCCCFCCCWCCCCCCCLFTSEGHIV